MKIVIKEGCIYSHVEKVLMYAKVNLVNKDSDDLVTEPRDDNGIFAIDTEELVGTLELELTPEYGMKAHGKLCLASTEAEFIENSYRMKHEYSLAYHFPGEEVRLHELVPFCVAERGHRNHTLLCRTCPMFNGCLQKRTNNFQWGYTQ